MGGVARGGIAEEGGPVEETPLVAIGEGEGAGLVDFEVDSGLEGEVASGSEEVGGGGGGVVVACVGEEVEAEGAARFEGGRDGAGFGGESEDFGSLGCGGVEVADGDCAAAVDGDFASASGDNAAGALEGGGILNEDVAGAGGGAGGVGDVEGASADGGATGVGVGCIERGHSSAGLGQSP